MIQKLKKTQGWEVRLNELFTRYLSLEFVRGENCCFVYISDGYEALTGESPLAEWKGNIPADKKKALALYRKNAGMDSFEKAFQWLEPVKSHKFAQRGDMGIMLEVDGTEILGIVSTNGREFLYRPEDRNHLVAVKLSEKIRLWRAS